MKSMESVLGLEESMVKKVCERAIGFELGVKERGSYGWWEWQVCWGRRCGRSRKRQVRDSSLCVLRPFVRDYPGEPVPEETLTHPPSWSSSNIYQLLPSATIHSILLVQITCLAIFLHNLSPCPQRQLMYQSNDNDDDDNKPIQA